MKFDVILIGGGIVGLATAYQIQKRSPNKKVLILEKESGVAFHQTGRNSGVIHSGIYYRPGSQKAINCRRGYQALLQFCKEHGVEYEICGKLIVATETSELQALYELRSRAEKNGLSGVRLIGKDELRDYEPHANGLEALVVPETGIISYVQVSQCLARLIQERGAQLELGQEVIRIQASTQEIFTRSHTFQYDRLISCAGLQSDRIAKQTESIDLSIIPFRGEYYEVVESKRYLVRNLIYPVPDPNFPFLGVHFTRMIGGGLEAGPNAVLNLAREGYQYRFQAKDAFDALVWPGLRKVALKYWRVGMGEFYRSLCKKAFVRQLQRLVPEIKSEDLVRGNCGIRAQACARSGQLLDDFKFVGSGPVLHVCNAPSPAATSSLAIGESIAAQLTL